MWAIRQRFKSLRVILPNRNKTNTHAGVMSQKHNGLCLAVYWLKRNYEIRKKKKKTKDKKVWALTWVLRFDQVEHLAEQILKG